LFDEGLETSAVAEQLGVKRDTLAKAIRAGRVRKPAKKNYGGKLSLTSRSSRALR
jgi:predicted site-specific integrase-resolvase